MSHCAQVSERDHGTSRLLLDVAATDESKKARRSLAPRALSVEPSEALQFSGCLFAAGARHHRRLCWPGGVPGPGH